MTDTEGRASPSVGFAWTVRDSDLASGTPILGAGYRLDAEAAQQDAAEILAANSGAIALIQAVPRTCDARIQQPEWNNEIEIVGVRFGKGVKWTAGTPLTVIAKLLAARRRRRHLRRGRSSPSTPG